MMMMKMMMTIMLAFEERLKKSIESFYVLDVLCVGTGDSVTS